MNFFKFGSFLVPFDPLGPFWFHNGSFMVPFGPFWYVSTLFWSFKSPNLRFGRISNTLILGLSKVLYLFQTSYG